MTFYSFVGSFDAKGSAGSQVVTFSPPTTFTPKAVIFWWVNAGSGWNTGAPEIGMGFATSAASAGCGIGTWTNYYASTGQSTHPLYGVNNGGQLLLDASLTSLDSNGFTLNWATTYAYTIYFLALGGTDITNATVKQWQAQGSTGTPQSVTGVGFKPDLVLTIGVSDTTAPPHVIGGTINTPASINFGAMDGNGYQWAHSHYLNAGGVSRWQSTSHCIEAQTTSNTALAYQASYSSMDSTGGGGFTVNWTTCSSTAYFFSLCLKGGGYQVGNWLKSSSAGSDIISISNVQMPIAVLVMSNDIPTAPSYTVADRMMIGASDGTNNRVDLMTIDSTNDLHTDNYRDATHSIYITNNDAETFETAGTIGGFTTNQFIANYSTHDGVATEICFIAFGTNGTAWSEDTPGPPPTPATAQSLVPTVQISAVLWTQTVVPNAAPTIARSPLSSEGINEIISMVPEASTTLGLPSQSVVDIIIYWSVPIIPSVTQTYAPGHAINSGNVQWTQSTQSITPTATATKITMVHATAPTRAQIVPSCGNTYVPLITFNSRWTQSTIVGATADSSTITHNSGRTLTAVPNATAQRLMLTINRSLSVSTAAVVTVDVGTVWASSTYVVWTQSATLRVSTSAPKIGVQHDWEEVTSPTVTTSSVIAPPHSIVIVQHITPRCTVDAIALTIETMSQAIDCQLTMLTNNTTMTYDPTMTVVRIMGPPDIRQQQVTLEKGLEVGGYDMIEPEKTTSPTLSGGLIKNTVILPK